MVIVSPEVVMAEMVSSEMFASEMVASESVVAPEPVIAAKSGVPSKSMTTSESMTATESTMTTSESMASATTTTPASESMTTATATTPAAAATASEKETAPIRQAGLFRPQSTISALCPANRRNLTDLAAGCGSLVECRQRKCRYGKKKHCHCQDNEFSHDMPPLLPNARNHALTFPSSRPHPAKVTLDNIRAEL
jgi:hypothetical protein